MSVSVVMPVLNEVRHLRAAVLGVMDQDFTGEIELLLSLGPSRDGTDALAHEICAADARVRALHNPSGRTPDGLNAAIAAASHDVIVRVDGHSILPRDYIRTAVETLAETGADNVGGVMAAEGTTAFEQAVARAMTTRLGVGNARFHTGGDPGPADTVYLGVFRRSALERVGGYDESFLRAQDWEMNYRIRRTGGLVWFQPRMRVSYRPRSTLRRLARQYFDYGRWRRVVMRQHPETVNLRYLAPPVALVGVVGGLLVGAGGLVLGSAGLRLGFGVPAAYAVGVLGGSAWTGRGLPPPAYARLPLVYATMHGAWGAGFLTSGKALGRGAAVGK